jgi:hypothetical protein
MARPSAASASAPLVRSRGNPVFLDRGSGRPQFFTAHSDGCLLHAYVIPLRDHARVPVQGRRPEPELRNQPAQRLPQPPGLQSGTTNKELGNLLVQRHRCRLLRPVEPVVSPGQVYRAGFFPCGEEAQFQDVLGMAGVWGHRVVFGHGELWCHGVLSCAGAGPRCSFHPSCGSCTLAVSGCARVSVAGGRRSAAGEAAGAITPPGPPLWGGSGPSARGLPFAGGGVGGGIPGPGR